MAAYEVLSPVGGDEQLLAAVRCGANAVYLGGKNFNARRNAANFTETDLQQAVSYCHARNVKVYVTVNTLVLDSEMDALEAEADRIAAAGADAVIIQDMAVLRLFLNRYPALKRYASTQTAVHNVDGARFLQDIGFDSIVLARELTLSEMETICSAVPLKAEAFIHGAHCMSVSGACYLSAMLGGRSGNRGLCAQPCRLNWTCGDSPYALSLKDMSLIPHIRQMSDAGVTSFKIEGRMKRPEYVAAATAACKLALEGKPYDAEVLRAVFSRSGFTDGYLTGKCNADMFGYRTKDDVTDAGNVLKSLATLYRNETPLIPVDMHFSVQVDAVILTVGDGTHNVSASLGAPELAIHRALDVETAKKSLLKTGGTPFFVRDFSADITGGFAISAAVLNGLRRQALDELLELRGRTQVIQRQPYTTSTPRQYTSSLSSPALWARFYAEQQITCANDFEKIILPAEQITKATIETYGERLVAQLPTLLFPTDEPTFGERMQQLVDSGLSAVWANNIYGVRLGQTLGLTVHGGFGLNVVNTEALQTYEEQGLSSQTISFELAMAKVLALGGAIPRGVLAYGRLPLMHFRNCPVQAAVGCVACGGNGELVDRKQVTFPVECGEKRFSTLLNSVVLDIAGKDLSGLDYQLLYFTRECAEEVAAITKRFQSGQKTDLPHTNGLYYRPLL